MNSPLNHSPAQTIKEHNDGLDTLKRLLDLVDNRQPLLDAHGAARKEMELTTEQRGKYNEAVEFMGHYEELAANLDRDQKAVKKAESDLQETEESFRAWRKEETDRLKAQKDAQDLLDRQLDVRGKKMDDDWKDMQREYSEKMTPIDDQRAQNEKDKQANEKEAQRLAALAKKLDKRAQKLATAVADEETEEAA